MLLKFKCVIAKQKLTLQKAQRGSSLVIAIFILVVLSLLGAALIEIMETNEEAFTYEVLGTRAYNAAQSGIQWEMQKLFPLRDASNPQSSNSAMCTTSDTIVTFSGITGLNNCSAIVNCELLTHESATTVTTNYFTVTSTGQCDINGEITSRTIEVQAKSID